VFDRVLHETLRLAQPHVAMRRNVGPELHIGDKAIPTGTYVVYPFADIHLDPALYPDPWAFNPARPEPKEPYSYAGWGAGECQFPLVECVDFAHPRPLSTGKTVCQGQRLARLELKLITAMMLLGFDYTVTDKMGVPARSAPRPNWNDTLTCRPPGGTCCLKYARTARPL
jgi:cytochrome P450